MSEGLKTLKDIQESIEIERQKHIISSDNFSFETMIEKKCFVKIREEAKKWITEIKKEMRTHISEHTDKAKIEWIKHFFNLEEKEGK